MPFDLPRDQATAWFDTLYAGVDRDPRAIPWASLEPCPWLAGTLGIVTTPGSAIVVGCGLGDDAEAVAEAGFDTVAFDVSDEAVEWCRERFPGSPVRYVTADLLDLPAEWAAGFDLVVENRTVQSLPPSLREEALDAVASLIAAGGAALVVAWSRPDGTIPTGPPWPLSGDEMRRLLDHGLEIAQDRSDADQFVWDLVRPA